MSFSNIRHNLGNLDGGGDHALIAAARQHLFGPSGASLTLNKLAETLDVSVQQLSMAFQRNFGVSLAVYARGERMRIAQRLLLQTSQSVRDIAGQLGFHSPANFSNAFREHTGKTPSEFRKAAPISQLLTSGFDLKWG